MRLIAGELIERISIERNVPSRSASGANVEAWQLVATVWAKPIPQHSREWQRAWQTNNELTQVFLIRGRLDVDMTMRVVHGSRIFRIVGLETTDGRTPCFVTNFWRAAKMRPSLLVRHSLAPANEMEMQSHHQRLRQRRQGLEQRLVNSPDYCDPLLAGWWLHGLCHSFAGAWLHPHRYRQKPSQRPGGVLLRTEREAREWMLRLQRRLQTVRVLCGDWKRLLTPNRDWGA